MGKTSIYQMQLDNRNPGVYSAVDFLRNKRPDKVDGSIVKERNFDAGKPPRIEKELKHLQEMRSYFVEIGSYKYSNPYRPLKSKPISSKIFLKLLNIKAIKKSFVGALKSILFFM